MNQESWGMIKGRILEAFPDAEQITAELEAPQRGQRETIVFAGPVGKMMLERLIRPVIVNTISHGARRVGSEYTVENVYDDEQTTTQVKLYRLADGDWLEVDINALMN